MKRRWRTLLIVALLLAGLYASTMLTAYTDCGLICENTGSRKGYREWFFGIRTRSWYQASELETFVAEQYPEMLEHRWTSYLGSGRSLIPFSKSWSHGSPGPILDHDQEMLDTYVNSLSEKQRLELYRDLSTGDEAVVRERVKGIQEFFLDGAFSF